MRTRYLDAEQKPVYTNSLIHEQSPYLKQHAHNPVDWFPWGDAAFVKARQEDKPIFLSIGYSTCHWCHVMEDESFDNEHIASILNEHFISIKLDREQRPDLDDIYMTGVQFISGQGGWPMSNFITADGEPFHAGTYYPAESFEQLLFALNNAWQNRRDEVMAQAKKVSASIDAYTQARSETKTLPDDLSRQAAAALLDRLDTENGGFGGAPKFPNESQLLALLASARRFGDAEALQALTLTLDNMYQGGIFDQIAGGFHRYTVDAEWLVPHFEKMLYNQAQLISVYAQAYSLTQDPAYQRVVAQTCDYLVRDMSDVSGAFFSATDADSEGVEGQFFVWQPAELKSSLSDDDFDLISKLYGVSEAGNFGGANILNMNGSLADFADTNKLGLADLTVRLDTIHKQLYERRERREHPLRDEKLITAWNGMMISSLVQAAIHLDEPSYGALAVRAGESIWQTAYSESEGLWRISLAGQVSIQANLEDYAYLAEAMLNLHKYTGPSSPYLTRGQTLVAGMLDKFWDQAGGFYISPESTEGPMISRPRSPMDGAMPSANSAALSALVLLHEATGDIEIASRIDACLASFAGLMTATPSAFCYMLNAVEPYLLGDNRRSQWIADGKVHVGLSRSSDKTKDKTKNKTTVHLMIAPGWHINAHDVGGELLVAAEVLNETAVIYPESQSYQSEFEAQAFAVYSGNVSLLIEREVHEVTLRLQVCSDVICLAPTEVSLSW